MSEAIIQHLEHNEVKQYIEDNCKALGNGFYEVVNDLKVWKKTKACPRGGGSVVVALLIPKHAVIYAGSLKSSKLFNMHVSYRKMRASKAIVVEQFKGLAKIHEDLRTMNVELHAELKAVQKSYSYRDYNFLYKTSAVVKPSYGFSMHAEQCSSGVHFFVNLTDALMY